AQSIPNNQWTTVAFDFELDNAGLFSYNATTKEVSVSRSAIFMANMEATWQSNANGVRGIRFRTPFIGMTPVASDMRQGLAYADQPMSLTAPILLDPTIAPKLDVQVFQNSGGALKLTKVGFSESPTLSLVEMAPR